MAKSMDLEIDRLVKVLGELEPTSEEYDKVVTRIDTLAKANSYTRPFSYSISGDTILVTIVGLVQTLAILNHENLNVISSKALGFVMKPK